MGFYGYLEGPDVRPNWLPRHATKTEMLNNAERLQAIIDESGRPLKLVAVNHLYAEHCVCMDTESRFGSLKFYSIYSPLDIRVEGQFQGWEHCGNLVQLDQIMEGQVDLFDLVR